MRKRRRGTAPAGERGLFVDSSAWIALFSGRDQNHAMADRLFRLALARMIPLHTTNLVIAEVHRLLLYRAGSLAALRVLSRIDSDSRVRVRFPSADDHRNAREWLDRLCGRAITYTDAVSFATMGAMGCTAAISFDRHFTFAGFDVWQVL